MSDLAKKRCIPCEGGMDPLAPQEAQALMTQLTEGWMLIDDVHLLVREYEFKDFAEALKFVNKVGAIAEAEGHHPDISFGWGRASIELTTHAIEGLSENDFIVAAKIDEL